jgi:hypothetical protein
MESLRAFGKRRLLVLIAGMVIVVLFATYGYLEVWSPQAQVGQAFLGHLGDIENASTSGDTYLLIHDYESGATMTWLGETGSVEGWMYNPTPIAGTFSNATSIQNLYVNFLDIFWIVDGQGLILSDVSYTVQLSGSSAVVNSSFLLKGTTQPGPSAAFSSSQPVQCPGESEVSATVAALVSYAHSSGGWLISNETWNFENVTCQ